MQHREVRGLIHTVNVKKQVQLRQSRIKQQNKNFIAAVCRQGCKTNFISLYKAISEISGMAFALYSYLFFNVFPRLLALFFKIVDFCKMLISVTNSSFDSLL